MIINSPSCYILNPSTILLKFKVRWKVRVTFKAPIMKSFQLSFILYLSKYLYVFAFDCLLISLKLRSTLNLTLRVQKPHSFLSSKPLTYNGIICLRKSSENKNISNELHEFIHNIGDLMRPLCICHFSLSNTHISDPKREYK